MRREKKKKKKKRKLKGGGGGGGVFCCCCFSCFILLEDNDFLMKATYFCHVICVCVSQTGRCEFVSVAAMYDVINMKYPLTLEWNYFRS